MQLLDEVTVKIMWALHMWPFHVKYNIIKDEDVQYRKGRYIRGEIIGASLLVKDRGDNKISKFLAI